MSSEAAAILRAVTAYPQGVGIDALQLALPDSPRRTLQRRLAQLVAAQQLVASGSARATRYHLAPLPMVATTAWVLPADLPARPYAPSLTPGAHGQLREPPADVYLPLSAEGSEIRALVQRPLGARTPVGYQRAFLDAYIPNVSAYLSPAMLAKLHALGRSQAGGQPAGTYARHVLGRLLIDLSWASSRLEGNTYTRIDTQNLIEFGMSADGKDQLEAQMILNHKAAIEMLVDNASEAAFNPYTICNLHALLSENLLPSAGASGRVRSIPVDISGTVYQPTAIPQLLAECFQLILTKAEAITEPFEQAFFILAQLPYLQPFEDVNKRVSRLGANLPLIRHNLAPLSFVDVPEQTYVQAMLGVYELNRTALLADVFLWAYQRSCQRYTVLKDALPEPDPLRLRYRLELKQVVSSMVRDRRPIEAVAIRQLAVALVAPEDSPHFVAVVANELHHLHEGNLVRYGLRVSEFAVWKQGLRPGIALG